MSVSPRFLEVSSCAEALNALFEAGFDLVTSRAVRETRSREIIVYDLIRD